MTLNRATARTIELVMIEVVSDERDLLSGVEGTDLWSLVSHNESLPAELPLGEVQPLFELGVHNYFAVLEAGSLKGVVSRAHVGTLMASRYGYSLHSRKPIGLFCQTDYLGITRGLPILEVLSTALSRSGEAFYDDVVLLDEEGKYLGLIEVQTLVKLQSKLLNEKIRFLQNRQGALRERNESLRELSDRLNRSNADLARARDAALEATRLKSIFLANMSHEIRTPMNGVIGFSDLLAESGLDDEQREFVGTIRSCAHSLLGIINDILDFSKIEAGKLTVENTPVDVRGILGELEAMYRKSAEDKRIRLVFDIDDRLPAAMLSDATRLRQILSNLLSNALKFTSKGMVGATVTLLEVDGDRRIHFEVKDTGMGIRPEVLERLFQPFQQADSSTTRQFGGTGLGLAICKQLVGLMGGEIQARSVVEEGTTMWFDLPVHLPVEPAPFVPAPVSKVSPLHYSGRVLLVEDNVVNQQLALRLLRKLGCEVRCANNGRLALEQMKREAFDLVFMDCHMPVMDGYQAVEAYRAWENNQPTGGRPVQTIVALTANVLEGDRAKCLQAGMNDFLAKPVRKPDLESVLMRYLGLNTIGEPGKTMQESPEPGVEAN